jgi:hypothetical protein
LWITLARGFHGGEQQREAINERQKGSCKSGARWHQSHLVPESRAQWSKFCASLTWIKDRFHGFVLKCNPTPNQSEV